MAAFLAFILGVFLPLGFQNPGVPELERYWYYNNIINREMERQLQGNSPFHYMEYDGNDRVYVPGSSMKGALRTVLLKAMMLDDPPRNPDFSDRNLRCNSFENSYFNKLCLKKDRNQCVQVQSCLNSIMQGVRISDSLPISDSRMCLAPKIDVFGNGVQHKSNICRECQDPGICWILRDGCQTGTAVAGIVEYAVGVF